MSKIYALKGPSDHPHEVKNIRVALDEGEGLFGWSYLADGHQDVDLRRIADKLVNGGRSSLTPHELECNQSFLLDLVKGDWVIYINVPSYGRCTIAQVAGPYYWKYTGGDFNHRFSVDPASVREFDRNDRNVVQPALQSRLKLQGKYWRIYASDEFDALLGALAEGVAPKVQTRAINTDLLNRKIEPLLLNITREVHRTHPNYDLELLVEQVFKAMPGVRKVKRKGGSGDHGADLIVEFESGLPIPVMQEQHVCVVQIKSYEGTHWDILAINDLRRAFSHYPAADMGMVISTADAPTPEFEAELGKLREETGKRVELLIGSDVARMILRYGDTAFFASDNARVVD